MTNQRLWMVILGALVAGVLIGRFGAPESVETKKKVSQLTTENAELKEKLTQSLRRESEFQKSKTITSIKHPDGKVFRRVSYTANKKTTESKESELTVEAVIEKSQKTDTEESSKTVNRRGAIAALHVLVPLSFSITPIYMGTFTAPIAGPFYYGFDLSTDPRIGLHFGFGF